jgi:hypothetical protein
MSILSMTRRAIRVPADQARSATAAAGDAALQRVVDYIPADVTALYIGLIGILPRTDTVKWGVFALGILLVPVFIYASLEMARRKTKDASLSGRDFFWLVLFGIVAYVIWVGAIPESPLIYLYADVNRYAAGAAFVCAAVMPKFAELLGLDAQLRGHS